MADSAIVNHSHADIQPYSTATSVILCLYNSSTAQVCKSLNVKTLFCAELLPSATDSNRKPPLQILKRHFRNTNEGTLSRFIEAYCIM